MKEREKKQNKNGTDNKYNCIPTLLKQYFHSWERIKHAYLYQSFYHTIFKVVNANSVIKLLLHSYSVFVFCL